MCTISRNRSLYFELLYLIIWAGFITGFFLFLTNAVGETLIDDWYNRSGIEQKKNGEYINKFQKYIDQKKLGIRSSNELNEWVRKQGIINLSVYKNNKLVYDSTYPDREFREEGIFTQEYAWEEYYDVNFSDGTAKVSISGAYFYQYYSYFHIIETVAASLLFVGILLLGIRRKIQYILKISEEIKILESGSLDYKITIEGEDELSDLAEGLDRMRQSIAALFRQEGDIMRRHQKVVTEMSHDLRTPITSMLLYLEIMRKKAIMDPSGLEYYIDKIENKAQIMKRLTEQIFDYSVLNKKQGMELEEPDSLRVLFHDILSDVCQYLHYYGFTVETDILWTGKKICVNRDYMNRIMDNITSNIIKYADMDHPVRIRSLSDERMIGFSFCNTINEQKSDIKSSNIGLQSVRYMTGQMGGKCIVKTDRREYEIRLLWPEVLEE